MSAPAHRVPTEHHTYTVIDRQTLDQTMRQSVSTRLHGSLYDAMWMRTASAQAGLNVAGPRSYALRQMFDEIRDECAEAAACIGGADTVARRGG